MDGWNGRRWPSHCCCRATSFGNISSSESQKRRTRRKELTSLLARSSGQWMTQPDNSCVRSLSRVCYTFRINTVYGHYTRAPRPFPPVNVLKRFSVSISILTAVLLLSVTLLLFVWDCVRWIVVACSTHTHTHSNALLERERGREEEESSRASTGC